MMDDDKKIKEAQNEQTASYVGANHTEDFMMTWGKVDLTKDIRAERLAKIALGWDGMTTQQRMDSTKALIARAQQIKETL